MRRFDTQKMCTLENQEKVLNNASKKELSQTLFISFTTLYNRD